MKKNTIRKTLVFLLIITLCSVFSGCKKKNVELTEEQQAIVDNVKYIMFEISCYNITGQGSLPNANTFYHPKELTELLSKRIYDRGRNFYLIEMFNPEKLGIIDSIGIYSGDDTAVWVDELLIKIEEERIADEIAEMEDSLEEYEDVQEHYEEEIEKALDENIEATEYLDDTDLLKFMEFDEEVFIPQKINDGLFLIHSVGGNVTRSFYDNSYRVTKKETWNISSVERSDLVQTEESIYDGESVRPQKIIVSSKNTVKEINYNSDGLITLVENFDIYKDKNYITSKITRVYDDEKRLIAEQSVDYTYKDEKYKKIDYKFTKKHIYKYNEGEDIPPDFEYFEDNVLKMKNKYSTKKGTYTSQIFFEDGFSVKTYYEEELKVRDVFYMNDEITREKIYER